MPQIGTGTCAGASVLTTIASGQDAEQLVADLRSRPRPGLERRDDLQRVTRHAVSRRAGNDVDDPPRRLWRCRLRREVASSRSEYAYGRATGPVLWAEGAHSCSARIVSA